MYNLIVLGIDPSYNRTGISLAADGVLKAVSSESFNGCENHIHKRNRLRGRLGIIMQAHRFKAQRMIVNIERARFNKQAPSFEAVKYGGALSALIVDVAYSYDMPTYSTPTVSWKAAVVGTSKPEENIYDINPAKWPTIKKVCQLGFADSIVVPVSMRTKKGVILYKGVRCVYNDDAADSAGLALYPFTAKAHTIMQLEE